MLKFGKLRGNMFGEIPIRGRFTEMSAMFTVNGLKVYVGDSWANINGDSVTPEEFNQRVEEALGEIPKEHFVASENHGFKMRVANGWTVSVQWGPHNYCASEQITGESHPKIWGSANAEIAIFKPDGSWFLNDQVKGYVTPQTVAEIIAELSKPVPDLERFQ